jgi:hypothetical protein
MTVTAALLAGLLTAQAAPVAQPAPATPSAPAATAASLPASVTCIYDELPARRPMVSLNDDAGMRQLAPIIFPADERCVARHSLDEAGRSRALLWAFNQHQLDFYETRLEAIRLPLPLMRRYFATMDEGQKNRVRTRTATRDDAVHLFNFLEREGAFSRIRDNRAGPGGVGGLAAETIILLVDEEDLITGRTQAAQ